MERSLVLKLVTAMALCFTGCTSEPSGAQTSSQPVTTDSTDALPPEVAAELAAAPPPKAKSDGITITAFLRGDGPDAAAAKAFEQGMDLAAEASSSPVVKRTVQSRAQGTANDPAFQSLLKSGGVPLVVYWQTTDAAPVAATLKQSKILAVPVWNVTKQVAALGTNVFGFGYDTNRSYAQFAKFAGNKLKSYRFGVISSAAEPFNTQSRAFIEETKSLGNTVVFDERAESPSTDFGALIARAKKEKCDTLIAVLSGEALVPFVKAARAGGWTGKLLVGDSFSAAEVAALGKDAEGLYLLQAWSDDPGFKAQYSAKFGGDADGITLGAAALGYDLVKCVETAGAGADSEAISYAWLSNPCEGLTGKTQFSGERIAQRVKRVLTVKSGKFELAS